MHMRRPARDRAEALTQARRQSTTPRCGLPREVATNYGLSGDSPKLASSKSDSDELASTPEIRCLVHVGDDA